MSIVRVLLADTFKPWREVTRWLIENEADLFVVHESSDGEDAVRQVALLRPDLAILDVALPGPGGIEAARRISQLSPKTKLLFLSAILDPEVVQAALDAGAQGYVAKAEAAKDLLIAIRQIDADRRFVSAAISNASNIHISTRSRTRWLG